MSELAKADWNLDRTVLAVESPAPAVFEEFAMRERFVALRDILIVLGLQVAFRMTMLLRRMNY